MDTTAAGRRALTRALAVLAVLLGLLAMHGLASTHHAVAATGQHSAAAVASPADEAVAHHAPAAAVVHDGAALAAPAGADCGGDCPDLGVLCVAVLLTGAALALLARRRSSPLLLAPARPLAPTRAPPGRLARGPDPVKELCISRT